MGPRVRTGRQVTAITRDSTGATVRITCGAFRATKVTVTVPPPVAARIQHTPPLPANRAALERNTYMGSVYEAIAVYERPFWRYRGRAEWIVLDNPGRAVFDTTAPDGPGHLCTLAAGPEARALDHMDSDARRDALLGPLVPHLGPDVMKRRAGTRKPGTSTSTPAAATSRCPNPAPPKAPCPRPTRRSAASTGPARKALLPPAP
ncbi:flavin monoamine oxidase family protein [Streptomyces sp. NPDC004779]